MMVLVCVSGGRALVLGIRHSSEHTTSECAALLHILVYSMTHT
jgi:hypothetical protein